ncbi:6-hydroxymethylpterin diphosphokinase MptE-like protein [Methanothermococcus sp.]|uniref:6-hydroxymethylpterin diphosphokinase MptE-like protein n=1 Tax=Methanothermococcus sp. TaxID=2614238 RepID=UPI0025E15890|nr:6-hydroxymethylpterin diphosphokinase MptE-like protein [Methanothermococcus sp.]
MELREWEPLYNEIMEDFGFSKEDDLKSALMLSDIIRDIKNNIPLNNMDELIKNKDVYVFGAGPSLKKHAKIVKELIESNYINENDKKNNNKENGNKYKNKNYIIISADGATKALLEENIVPDIIVSDLDGDLNSIFESNERGSVVVVHAHGDNMDNIKNHVCRLKNIIGSSQVPKDIPYLINYGGFTDGDRCCFFAEHFGAKRIILCGMDFGEYTTKYSRPYLKNDIEKADDIKIKKLQYAEKLINWLKENGNSEIVFIDEL